MPGGKLQSEQVPGRPAAGVGLVPGGTGSVQTGQHGVPYPELGALVGHGIAGSADVQPQGIGTYRIAGVQLGAAPGRRLPQAAQQKSERKADAQVLHLPPGKHLTHKKTDPSSGNDIQRMGLLELFYTGETLSVIATQCQLPRGGSFYASMGKV